MITKETDEIEVLSEQIQAITDLWDIVLAGNFQDIKKERMEELLLEILKVKSEKLNELTKSI